MNGSDSSSSRIPYHPSTHSGPAVSKIPTGTLDRCAAGRVTHDHMVAMRDGVRLATDVYLPDAAGPFPSVLIRMPYGKTDPHCFMPVVGHYFSEKGYACVVQDVRGKWGSEGEFHPADGDTETKDGYDTIQWITEQGFSNGRVGMWGESYYGYTSYAGAVGGHPALACIAPGNISVDRYRNAFRDGAFNFNTIGNWALSMDVTTAQDAGAVDPWHLPLTGIPATGNIQSAYYNEIMANPHRGAFWASRSLLDAYAKLEVPALIWCGWFDTFLGAQLGDWAKFQERLSLRDHLYLFVGPWDHEGSADQCDKIGAFHVGLHGAHRWDKYQAFFDHYLMGLDNGFDRAPHVEVFTLGKNVWRQEREWPLAGTQFTPYYLGGEGHANTLAGDGTLSATLPTQDRRETFSYDPANPVADTLGMNCWGLAEESRDRRPIEARDDVLVFSTAPLTAPIEITGPIKATLHAMSSVVDTDFWVGLTDVGPDGYVTLIQDGIMRASARDEKRGQGSAGAPPLKSGQVYPFEIDLWATSHVFQAGHRIRVEISSSCFNKFDRNPNTGDPFGQATKTVTAHQTILHGPAYPSHILLPIIPSS